VFGANDFSRAQKEEKWKKSFEVSIHYIPYETSGSKLKMTESNNCAGKH